MKKFNFTIRGRKYDVEILGVEENTATVEVNGTAYEVEISRPIKTTKTPTLIRSVVKPPQQEPVVNKGLISVTAPLPGNIIQIDKQVGDKISRGELVLKYEAMKMENKILAESDGEIKSLRVKVGDSVLQGDVLFEIG